MPRSRNADELALLAKVVEGLSHDEKLFFNSLTEHEKLQAIKVYLETIETGETKKYDLLWEADYIERPVSIQTFLTDKYYFGSIGDDLWPCWHAELISLFGEPNTINEVIVSGAIGTGKTTFAVIALARKLYEILCLRSPSTFFGLSKDMTSLVFGLFNMTMKLSQNVHYAKIVSALNSSPYFRYTATGNVEKLEEGKEGEGAILHMPNNIRFAFGCLAGTTKIPLLDGTCVRIKDLVGHPEFWVYSYDRRRRKIVPGKALAVYTGQKNVLKVKLDNGKVVTASEDHKWLLHSGRYVKTRNLKPGDSLMPLYRKLHTGYEMIQDPDDWRKWKATHKIVAEECLKKPSDPRTRGKDCGLVVHHKNQIDGRLYNKRDNRPEMLQWMDWDDHQKLHGKRSDITHDVMLEFIRAGFILHEAAFALGCTRNTLASKGYGEFDEYKALLTTRKTANRSKLSKRLLAEGKSGRPFNWKVTGLEDHCRWRGDVWSRSKDIANAYEAGDSIRALQKLYQCSRQTILRVLGALYVGEYRDPVRSAEYAAQKKATGYAIVSQKAAERRVANHKVVSVTIAGSKDCYDLCVKKYHNFALESGVFVHNSRALHALGSDIIGGMLDETNFSILAADYQVLDLYRAVRRRIESRFPPIPGKGWKSPGLLFLVSSSKGEEDFLEKHIQENNKTASPTTRVISKAMWEAKAHIVGRYSGETFRVMIGNGDISSKVLEDNEVAGEDCEIIDVPVEHKNEFVLNTDEALMDIAGKSVSGGARKMVHVEKIRACIFKDALYRHKKKLPARHHPFNKDVITLTLDGADFIEDFIIAEQLLRCIDRHRKRYEPIINPTQGRFIHLDPATSGKYAFGFAMGHIAGFKEVLRRDPKDFVLTKIKAPYIYMDIMLKIVHPPGKEIDLSKIRAFIMWLRSHGYPIHRVTADGFQSTDTLQQLKKQYFDADLYSVDKKPEGYAMFRDCIQEERLLFYDYPVLVNTKDGELLYLQRNVEGFAFHLPDMLKDVCLRGSTETILLDGTYPTIQDLYSAGRKDFWTVAFDEETQSVVPAKVLRVKRTKLKTKRLLRITLDDGSILECTEDHRWMTRDGKFIHAEDLKPGSSMMPYYEEEIRVHKDTYKCFYDPITNKQIKRYAMVAAYCHPTAILAAKRRCKKDGSKFSVIHHKNHVKHDDSPNNLEPLTNNEHRKLHGDIFVAYNKSEAKRAQTRINNLAGISGFGSLLPAQAFKMRSQSGRKNLTKYNQSEAHRKVAGEVGKRTIRIAMQFAYTPESIAKKVATRKRKMAADPLYKAKYDKASGQTLRVYNRYQRFIKSRGLTKAELPYLEWKPTANHSVVAVEVISVDDSYVYDFVMDKYHNFAVKAGVFSHNCDAMCGVVGQIMLSEDAMFSVARPITPLITRRYDDPITESELIMPEIPYGENITGVS